MRIIKILSFTERGKLGLGSAYIEGFKWFLNSNYSNCLQMDGDFSHSFNDLNIILNNKHDADLVIGSRYTVGGSTEGWSLIEDFYPNTQIFYLELF